jgi:opacity protein-like surface antigen
VWIGIVVCLLSTTPGWAQERGFARFLGGVTFGTAAPSSILGGAAGANITPNLQVTGELGRIQDVVPSEIDDALDLLSTLFFLRTGVPLELDVKAPVFYGMAGLRFNVPTTRGLRPFVDVQAGAGKISFDIDARAAGVNISDQVEDQADLESASEILFGIGGGVALGLTDALGLDLGYRYHRIFTDDPAVNVNALYAALRLMVR